MSLEAEEREGMSRDDGSNCTGSLAASVSKLCEMEAASYLSFEVEVKEYSSKQIVLRQAEAG